MDSVSCLSSTDTFKFEEAKGFVNQCSKDSSIVKLAKEVQFLQSKTQAPLSSPQSISELESFPELLQILQSLPSKSICDRLVAIYTSNFEKTLRILHIPCFLRQYAHFWASPEDESYLSSPFIPQLTAVLTVSIILGEESIKMENITSWEYLRLNAVGLLQAWLQKIPRKHRTELTTLQIETLMLLARQLRLTSAEESWKAAGSLVRSAMVMGLHIDLSGSTKMSVFQAENRRRLWITIAEMDLQASITSGMPIMTPQVDFHTLSPANLNDADFDESTTELPALRPLDESTDTLPLVTLARTLSHRINAMNFIQTGSETNLDERLKQGRQLEKCLRDIPYPLKIDHTLNNDIMPPVLMNQVLLDLYIRRPLLCLYRPVSTDNNRDNTALQEIQRACLDSSLTILSYQDYFDPNLADLDAQNSHGYWDIFHTFCKNDVLWAALSVCKYMGQYTQHTPTTDQHSSNGFSDLNIKQNQSHSKTRLTRLVENTLDSLSRRIGEAGNNVKDIVLLAVVLQSVRGRGSPEMKDRWMTQGVKKALSACRQYLLPAVTDQHATFGVCKMHHAWDIA
jgi:enamine deaminase RidA (YjgF/YER057c/UK114 family)